MKETGNIQKGTLFSVEEFAVNDGPGIRTTIFLKGCPLHCAWCHNPEGISPEPQYMDKKGEQTLCGYTVTSEELAALILRNKEIYTLNEGGVTFTGGEPLLQSAFLSDVLKRIRPEVHTAIETSGFSSVAVFREIVSLLDLVLFDVKHTDSVLHKKYTGADNRPILRNLEWLCASDTPFIIRIPLIPGVNDTKENMLAVLALIKEAKALRRVEILRYHKMAGAKYNMIGQDYNPPFDTEQIPQVYNVFEENNIKTIIL